MAWGLWPELEAEVEVEFEVEVDGWWVIGGTGM